MHIFSMKTGPNLEPESPQGQSIQGEVCRGSAEVRDLQNEQNERTSIAVC